MQLENPGPPPWVGAAIVALLCGPAASHADVVTEANSRAAEIACSSGLSTPAVNRAMALVQTAVYAAANSVSRRYPDDDLGLGTATNASIDAAIAAAQRATLLALLPLQRAAIEDAYAEALSALPDDAARDAGVAAGQRAAAAVLAARKDDGAAEPETYRPHTSPGAYVPTSVPIASQWPARKPWLMSTPAQFRPAPPPALSSERWARDYAEIKSVGGRDSVERTPEQTAKAQFWETTLPTIYYGVVQSVATIPGRDVTQNARLYAAVTQAVDDAMIAVFDAKYHYGFWRPITAIRKGDTDDNDATLADPSWTPFIETPLHPEYPCAHCIVAATIGSVLLADLDGDPQPVWRTTSPSADGAAREWTSIDAFVQEVADARVYDGVHFRYSTEVGTEMGRQIGALAAARTLAQGLER
jgi:hypothetical protein